MPKNCMVISFFSVFHLTFSKEFHISPKKSGFPFFLEKCGKSRVKTGGNWSLVLPPIKGKFFSEWEMDGVEIIESIRGLEYISNGNYHDYK